MRLPYPAEFFVVPLRLYLFGSLLTNKPNPADVDLLFQYQERSDLDPDEILYALTCGKPLPHNKALSHLRKGMQMVRFELLPADSSPEVWIRSHEFDPETPFKLIWERGFDWKNALHEVETQPVVWCPTIEQRNKHVQEMAKRIAREQGLSTAIEWMQKQKSGAAGGNR